MKHTFSSSEQVDFFNRLMILGKNLEEEQKIEFCESILQFFPEMLEELAEYYDLPYLLNDVYSEKIVKIKILNNKLYEQLKKI